MLPGRNGNWVRTGISWSSLDYFRYGPTRTPQAAEQLLLIKELLALSRLANRRNLYSYSEEVVRLETINSRRLWDLLGEARALGLPLLQSGRNARPVTFLQPAAAVTIDVTRTDSGLRVEPRIGTEDLRLPLETSMLIGNPAHGIAWWDESPGSGRSPQSPGLGLAALATPVDDKLRAFLRMATVDVPHHDEERFLRALVPKLRRKVAVASSDLLRRAAQGQAHHRGPHHRGRRPPSDRVDLVARGAGRGVAGGPVERPEPATGDPPRTPSSRRPPRSFAPYPSCSSEHPSASAWLPKPSSRGSPRSDSSPTWCRSSRPSRASRSSGSARCPTTGSPRPHRW